MERLEQYSLVEGLRSLAPFAFLVAVILFPLTTAAQVVSGALAATEQDLDRIPSLVELPSATADGNPLPQSWLNSEYLSEEVGDQGNQSSCVAFAIANALNVIASNSVQKKIEYSPYWIWDTIYFTNLHRDGRSYPRVTNCANWADGTRDCARAFDTQNREAALRYQAQCRDCGCSVCSQSPLKIVDALKVLGSGIPPLTVYPKPTCGIARTVPYKHILHVEYQKLVTRPLGPDSILPEPLLDSIRREIVQGVPVVVALRLRFDRSYHGSSLDVEDLKVDAGYHAMTVVGYGSRSDSRGVSQPSIKLINSWGKDWGDQGYLWLTYNAFRAIVREAYTITVRSEEDRRAMTAGDSFGKLGFRLDYLSRLGNGPPLCLDANTFYERDPTKFDEVIAYQCKKENPNQYWELINTGPDSYALRAYNGKYLAVAPDTQRIYLEEAMQAPEAEWKIRKTPDDARYLFVREIEEAAGIPGGVPTVTQYLLSVDSVQADFYDPNRPPRLKLSRNIAARSQQWEGAFKEYLDVKFAGKQ